MEKKITIWNPTYTTIFIANLAMVVSQFLVNPLITTYASWLGAGTTLVGMLSGLYFAVAFLMRPVAGPAVTMLNHRKLLIATYIMGVAVNLMYAFCPTIGLFVLARVLHGVEFSVLGSLLMAMAGDALPPEKLGTGLGMFSLGAAVGTALGPTIGMALQNLGVKVFGGVAGGYKMAFLGAAVAMAIALIPCLMCHPAPRDIESIKKSGKWYSNIVAPGAIVPALLLALTMMSNNLYTAYLVPYSAENNLSGISFFFTFYAGAMLASRLFIGRATEKFGAKAVIIPGLIIYAISFVIVSLSKSIVTVYIAAIFAAVGYSTANPAMQALCIQSAPPEKRGAASNTAYFGTDLGLFLGPAIGGFIIKAFEPTGHAYSKLYMFGVVPLLAGIALYLVILLRQKKTSGLSK